MVFCNSVLIVTTAMAHPAKRQDTDSNGSHCAQRFTLLAPTRRSKSSLGKLPSGELT